MSRPGRRRQALAFVLSGVFPGLGQLYNREWVKGVAFLVAGAVPTWLLARVTPTDPRALVRPEPSFFVLLAVLLAIWLWSAIDAWRVAGRGVVPPG